MCIFKDGIKKHADIVKQWLDGAEVQWWCEREGGWVDMEGGLFDDKSPNFREDTIWRVKPKPKMVPWDIKDFQKYHRETNGVVVNDYGSRSITGVSCTHIYCNCKNTASGYSPMSMCANFRRPDGSKFEKTVEVEE